MADALGQVKRQFGQSAVILSTKSLSKGGLFGFGSRGYVEITAARTMSDLPDSTTRGMLRRTVRRGEDADGAAEAMSSRSQSSATADRRSATRTSEAVLSEIGSLKSLMTDLVCESRRTHAPAVPEKLYASYLGLIKNDVAERLARQLMDQVRDALSEEQLHDPEAVRAQLASSLESMLPVAGPIRIVPLGGPTIIALVGPTGVGKTTTIAKLAANFRLRQHRKVGLITVDTYRIAAVEQLKIYAQIIEVPLEVASTPKQLEEAVARMADRDVVLIDTAGRSQRDTVKIKELQEFFKAVTPHEVHLVLSGTSSQAVLSEAIDRFNEVGIDRVILTKLDEAIGFGVILTCLEKAKAKLSYVTTGQDVPDDIAVGEGKTLAELILGERLPQNDQRALSRANIRAG